ncbi:MAG: hypothetical protein JNM60_06335 [Candidatus Competibacteraceae bacterium]|nr:hypothetical protein [Candidatus Competibacteraceae bacterium]
MKAKMGWALAVGALLMNAGLNPADESRLSLLGGAAVRAEIQVDFGFFHEELAPFGQWRRRPPYGWVWYPEVSRNWRPYTIGYWIFTDDYGWTWVSDDPWGSLPFHYGRWFYDDFRGGWAWVPGAEWGPAWVGWRSGGGYIGWAPLPPSVEFDPSVGFAPPDQNFGESWGAWYFVPSDRFLSRRVDRFIAPRPRVSALLNNTVNVTRYTVIDRRVVNRSLDPDRIERDVRRPVVRHQVEETDRPSRRGPSVQDGRIRLFRPQVVGSAADLAPARPDRPRRRDAQPGFAPEPLDAGAGPWERPAPGRDPNGRDRPGRQAGEPPEPDDRERARNWAEREQRRQIEQDRAGLPDEERARRQAEREQARQEAVRARRQTEQEQARQLAEQERAQRQAEREAQRQAEQARRQAEQQQARQQSAEQERAQRQAEREQARQQAIEERRRMEHEQARPQIDQERAQRQAEREQARQQQSEQERAQRQAEREQARQQAIQQLQQLEQDQLRQRAEQQRAQQQAEQAQRQAEREARRQAEQNQRQAERQAQRQAERQAEQAQRQAERQAEQAQRQAEREQARQQAIQQRQQQQQQQQAEQERQRRRNLPECKSLPPGQQQECR